VFASMTNERATHRCELLDQLDALHGT
jgi:hypothetical protein